MPLKLRKELKLFANADSAILNNLLMLSSLKPEIVSGLDIMIVREIDRRNFILVNLEALNLLIMEKEKELIHILIPLEKLRELEEYAFDLQKRNNKIREKSNVMEADNFGKRK